MEQSKGYRVRWIALIFISLSLLIISVDNYALNLALPHIARDLGSSASELQWIVDAYILVFAALLLTTGSIADRIGRKWILQAGLVLFGCFSLGAALSESTGSLVAMRALMGLGAATFLPATLSILTATFRQPKERAQAIGIWAAVFTLGIALGPLVGGALLEHFSWNSIFFINIPIAIVGLVGGQVFIQNSKDEYPRKIDIPGILLSITGFFALVYAIIQAGEDGWTATSVLAAFGTAAVLLTGFVLWEKRTTNAMLPLSFFKNMSFTGANLALTFVMFALAGALFFLGQYLQSVQGYTPLQAGVRLLPMAGVAFVAAIMSVKAARLIGTKYTVALGILIAAAGLFYFSQLITTGPGYGQICLGTCIVSLGIGLVMSPATNSVMGSVPVGRSGIGSAMNDTNRQVGGALGVAVLGTLMNSTYIAKIKEVSWFGQLTDRLVEAIRSSIQGAHIAAQNVPDGRLSEMIINEANAAFTSGVSNALTIAAIIMAASAVVALIVLPNRVQASGEKGPGTLNGPA
ncbi:MAG: MFS transporter [Dehalococcoidales bacterium]|nr:MFS transporter [Dehalococcoidales bacterium]